MSLIFRKYRYSIIPKYVPVGGSAVFDGVDGGPGQITETIMKMKKLVCSTGGVLAIAAGLAPGAGYYLPNQDAFATAKGNAFVATADSAAAVHYNPAGLTQLERPEAQLGFYGIVLGNEANVGGLKYETETEFQVAPHLYYAGPINEDFAWGIGINSPFGLGNDWGHATPFRTVVTEARLAYIATTGAIAYAVTDEFSVGASLSLNYLDLALEQGLGPFPAYLRFEGDGVSVSAGLSARWQPHEQHAFGLTMSTESSTSLTGKVISNVLPSGPAKMDFMTPFRAAAGYSYRPAPGWNIEANVEWLDWDSLNNLTLFAPTVPGGAMAVPFQWESMFIYEIGFSYTTDEGYVFAAGYDYNSSAQPDTFYNPGVADADRHWLNAGFGQRTEDWDWFLTYQFGYSNRTVTGALPNFAGQAANGKYEGRHHAIVFSWQLRF